MVGRASSFLVRNFFVEVGAFLGVCAMGAVDFCRLPEEVATTGATTLFASSLRSRLSRGHLFSESRANTNETRLVFKDVVLRTSEGFVDGRWVQASFDSFQLLVVETIG